MYKHVFVDGKVFVNCVMCKDEHVIHITEEQYTAWQLGKYIQDAMPEIDAGKRELLISGTCPKCWEKLFGN